MPLKVCTICIKLPRLSMAEAQYFPIQASPCSSYLTGYSQVHGVVTRAMLDQLSGHAQETSQVRFGQAPDEEASPTLTSLFFPIPCDRWSHSSRRLIPDLRLQASVVGHSAEAGAICTST